MHPPSRHRGASSSTRSKRTVARCSQRLGPSFQGILMESRDALLIINAAERGHIPLITRRPSERERQNLIASGHVFVYCEETSGIKRWTDGASWSPSRILGNFLIYRELGSSFPAGQRKRAVRNNGDAPIYVDNDIDFTSEYVRKLCGSLIDSYQFKLDGLVKKTFTANLGDKHYHLVSYYTLKHALSGTLRTPGELFPPSRLRMERYPPTQWRTKLDAYGYEIAKDHNRTPSPPSSPAIQQQEITEEEAAPVDASLEYQMEGSPNAQAPFAMPVQYGQQNLNGVAYDMAPQLNGISFPMEQQSNGNAYVPEGFAFYGSPEPNYQAQSGQYPADPNHYNLHSYDVQGAVLQSAGHSVDSSVPRTIVPNYGIAGILDGNSSILPPVPEEYQRHMSNHAPSSPTRYAGTHTPAIQYPNSLLQAYATFGNHGIPHSNMEIPIDPRMTDNAQMYPMHQQLPESHDQEDHPEDPETEDAWSHCM